MQPSPAPASTAFPWTGLISVSGAVFLSVTAEMLPAGLLPDMSDTLGVSQAQVGLLVAWFAFTVVLTSAPLNHLTRKLPRHGLVVAVLVVLAVGNLLTAAAPDYGFLVAARVLGGLAHGLFWSVVGAYTAHLVPKEQIGRAVSVTIAGGSLAFVVGVPLATAVGHALGWRLSFLAIGALMLASAAFVWRFLPRVARHETGVARDTDAASHTPGTPRRDPTLSAVTLLCLTVALIMTGHYMFYTYIAPFLIERLGVDAGSVAPLLLVYGIAGAGGLVLSGSVFGRRPQAGLVISLVVGAVAVSALAAMSANLPVAIAAFVLWGIAFGVLPPLLQTRLLHTASLRVRDAASAFYTTAFNTGIGGGALLGALLLDLVGLAVMPFVYVGILLTALVLVLATDRVGGGVGRAGWGS